MASYNEIDEFLLEIDEQPHKQVHLSQYDLILDLPAELPAISVLKFNRHARQDTLKALDDFLSGVLGDEQYERVLATKMSFKTLDQLARHIMLIYSGGNSGAVSTSKNESGVKGKRSSR